MAETWSKLVVSLDTLDPAMIDLLSHLLFEARAIGVDPPERAWSPWHPDC